MLSIIKSLKENGMLYAILIIYLAIMIGIVK